MTPRCVGTTSIEVSPIGFGAFKIGRNEGIKYAAAYDLPSEDETATLLNAVVDLGITYIDTAPAYGVSEVRVGRSLSHRRDDLIISTKVGETFEDGRSSYDFSGAATRSSIERSLRRLQTDHLDIVFVHSNGDDLKIQQETDIVETLQSLRESGEVRAIGFSGKTVEGARAALDWADVLMVEYHLDDRSHRAVMDEATGRAGVVVKKALASGRLSPDEAIRFALDHPAVCSAVVGSLNIDHLDANVRSASDARRG